MSDNAPGCGWLDVGNEECDAEATDEIVIRDKIATGVVGVCARHKAEYNKKAAATRVTRRDNNAAKKSAGNNTYHMKRV